MNIYTLYTSHRERKMRINYSGVWDLHSHCQVLDERRGVNLREGWRLPVQRIVLGRPKGIRNCWVTYSNVYVCSLV
jgi:hypothetical protein